MSHVAKIDVVIKDLEALQAACEALGLEFVQGQKTFKWYGRWVNDYSAEDAAYHSGIKPEDYGKCEHAIRIPGNSSAYEIGVVRNPNGEGYSLVYDFYNGGFGMSDKVGGKKCEKLVGEYGKGVARNQAKSMAKKYGYGWTEDFNETTGETTITLRRY